MLFHPHDHSDPAFPQRSNMPSCETGILAQGVGLRGEQRPVPGRDGVTEPHPIPAGILLADQEPALSAAVGLRGLSRHPG